MIKMPPSKHQVWSHCTMAPYLWMQQKKIKSDSHEPLEESEPSSKLVGLVAHELFAICMSLKCDPRTFIGQTVHVENSDQKITPEIAENVDQAIEYCTSFLSSEMEVLVEETFSLNHLIPGQVVIPDLIFDSEEEVHVFDFKYGAGHIVKVNGNGQLMLGVDAFLQQAYQEKINRKIKIIVIHVMQPRMNHYALKQVSPIENSNFRIETDKLVKIINNSKKRKYVAGDHCAICKVPNCKARFDKMVELISATGEIKTMSDLIDHESLDDDTLVDLYLNADFIIAAAKNIKGYCLSNALKGKQYPRLKMIEGRKGNREPRDRKQWLEFLVMNTDSHEKRYNSELISVKQAEDLIGKRNLDNDEFEKLYVQKPGVPTLVPDDDPRPALLPGGVSEDEFEELED